MAGSITYSPYLELPLCHSSALVPLSECAYKFMLFFQETFDIRNHGYITFKLLLLTIHLPLLIKRLAFSSASSRFAIQAGVLVLVALMCHCWPH